MNWKCIALEAVATGVLAGCGDEPRSENPSDTITTVILNFGSTSGSSASVMFNDPDGIGGASPTIDPVDLSAGSYTLTVRFQNRLISPLDEATDTVRDEQNQYLVLFTGTAVVGPATSNTSGPLVQSYADMDGNGLPVGLTCDISASAGSGELTVTLRYMPPEQPPPKSTTTVTEVKNGGIGSIGGSSDAQVSFAVSVH